MDALVNSLGKAERDLLRGTEEERLAALDEDGLIKLHKRIRKARNKYVGVYRRAGAKKVGKKGGRGLARKANARNAGRAEAFEDALARVSARLGEVAAASAAELRADRLGAAARPGTWPGAHTPEGESPEPTGDKVTDRTPKGTGSTRRVASSRAAGARRQAKKDAR